MKSFVSLLAISSLLAGCGSFVPIVKLNEQTPETRNKVAAVRILGQAQAFSGKYEVLTMVEGHSCQNKLYDPPATRVSAIEQIKFHAYEAGANAITNLQCGGREGTSMRTNCWELISCTAEAIKLP
jgi:hypothetical protein